MSQLPFSPAVFRAQFPLFAQQENRDLVYLDNAATTHKPQAVIQAVGDFYVHSNSNTHRSSHRLARRSTEMVERVREQAAIFLNAASAREVVFCRGATEALNLLAYSLCSGLDAGDEIVLSTIEHHANLVPWQMAAARHQLRLRYVPHTAGVPRFDRLHEVVGPRTRIVSLTGGSNALGLRPDFAQIRNQLAGYDLRWIVDGAQLAAHEAIDVDSIGCDFLVCSAHKFYGPTGIGLLYGREQWLESLPPWQGGGEMIAEVGLYESEYAGLPHRFEAGTSSLADIAALGAALEFLRSQDRVAMAAHEQALLARLHEGIGALPGMRLLSQPQHNLGVLACAPEAGQAADLMHWLDGRDIAVRVGHHCAQPLLHAAGTGATVRASVAAYNTFDDVEAFLLAVADYLQLDQSLASAWPGSAAWAPDDLGALQLERLAAQRNWQDRYRELLRWGKAIAVKPEIRRPENLVRGCEADAWLVHRQEGDRHYFAFDSDSRVVKGLGALLLSQVDGRRAEEIRNADLPGLFAELGLARHLSESRSNGFYALLRQVWTSING
ncbi:aminotransferase class V-fold PLP-dependent enzyme [Microbulbifer yueqingensis]|uniref:cysteine desulfurase n=1 Tax=Microbulbifer yueqingensis TaxID=658219 RepID=A0A1G9AIJ5_9GAMM|nr:aminotransferase class V-fold PLP-dependent enzyme [Microbulbifer yueqingensis]SDK27078.1 cysteine desulfurase [Microbulbifer yueqingensis]